MRVGQKGTLTRVWAETGSRPTAPRADGYQSVYLFGAVCPGRDLGCARILPRCDTAAMALFLAELGGHVAPGRRTRSRRGDAFNICPGRDRTLAACRAKFASAINLCGLRPTSPAPIGS